MVKMESCTGATGGGQCSCTDELNSDLPALNYSINEIDTGLTWTDGKKIYKKTISYTNSETIGSATGTNTYNIPHGISNLSTLIKVEGSKSGGYVLPHFNSEFTGGTIVTVDSSNIVLRVSKDTWSKSIWYFTLYYTKTS